MRKLVMTRGASGSGKSRFLKDGAGMAGHILASDDVRLMLGAPVLTLDGRVSIDQTRPHLMMPMLKGLFGDRLARGETMALDMVQESPGDIDTFVKMARDARYEILLVDFGDVPLDMCLAANRSREPWRIVPEETVRRQHANVLQPVKRGDVKVVRWSGDGAHVEATRRFLDVPTMDLSAYDAVVHVGDLQGCHDVLAGAGGPLEGGIDPRKAYVFVGDLLDRGIENGKVMRWFLEHCVGKDNVFLIRGNHEEHIARWAAGQQAVSQEFSSRTLPQLLQAGVVPADGGLVMDMARDALVYAWRGHKVLVTHAGLPTVPENIGMVPSIQMSNGIGGFEEGVDEAFDRHAPAGWVQVHGHRNPSDLPVLASGRSFNLEGKVEFGGSLRLATLSSDGWTTSQHRNRVFAPAAERRNARDKTAAPWMSRKDAGATISSETVASLRSHPGVKEAKAAASLPHVSSFAFTKDVFYQQSWDDVVVKARGLFVDTDTVLTAEDGSRRYPVVARGYEKFFNLGERPETAVDAFVASASYPVTAYLKDNGFLGILSVDPKSGDLFVASKSKADGRFADMFRDILGRSMSPDRLDRVRRWLSDNDACMTFEVIDPVRDPHIVEYESERIVLLDVFRRSEEVEKLPYDRLKELGEHLGFEVKRYAAKLSNEATLRGFLTAMARPGKLFDGRIAEGFVLEDAAGGMVKLKCEEYAFWKRMRSAKERMLGAREGRLSFSEARYASDERAAEVVGWMSSLPDAELRKDVVAIRKLWEAERAELDAGPRP